MIEDEYGIDFDINCLRQKLNNLEGNNEKLNKIVRILKTKLDNVYQAIHFLGIDIDDSNVPKLNQDKTYIDEKPEYMEIPTDEEMKEIYKKLNSDLTNEEKAKLRQIFIKKED